jgi:hypothetical protein
MDLLHTNLIVITTTVDNYNTSLLRLGTERVPLNLTPVPASLYVSQFISGTHTSVGVELSAPQFRTIQVTRRFCTGRCPHLLTSQVSPLRTVSRAQDFTHCRCRQLFRPIKCVNWIHGASHWPQVFWKGRKGWVERRVKGRWQT